MQRGKILLIGVLLIFFLGLGLSFDINGSTCVCYNATDCNSAINSSSCSIVRLGEDINGSIYFENVSNKILNGQGFFYIMGG